MRPLPYVLYNPKSGSTVSFDVSNRDTVQQRRVWRPFDTNIECFSLGRVNGLDNQQVATTAEGDKLTG